MKMRNHHAPWWATLSLVFGLLLPVSVLAQPILVQQRQPNQGVMDDGDSRPSNETTPKPDPTVLTTQQLIREIFMLREIIETRLAGGDKAIELLQTRADRIPDQIQQAVEGLQRLQDERFASIAVQFAERDTRTEQTLRDGKVAIDAALQAQEKSVDEKNDSNAQAIAKSEAGFTKQIDQILLLINSQTGSLNDKIDDMKTRLTSIESMKIGGTETKAESIQTWGFIFGLGGLGIAAIMLVMRFTGSRPRTR